MTALCCGTSSQDELLDDLSLVWTTPIGPLRFNFAHALKKEEYDLDRVFDLTISTKF